MSEGRAKAAKRHNEVRAALAELILEKLGEGPMGREGIKALCRSVPGVTPDDISATLTTLGGRFGKIERRGWRYYLTGIDRTKPITKLEKEVFAALGSGRTAREMAQRCELVRDAFTARTVLEAMVVRGVIARRRDSSPPVYETLEPASEAAAS